MCPECSIPDVRRYTCHAAQIVAVKHAGSTLSSFFMSALHALACIGEQMFVFSIPLGVPTPAQRSSSFPNKKESAFHVVESFVAICDC